MYNDKLIGYYNYSAQFKVLLINFHFHMMNSIKDLYCSCEDLVQENLYLNIFRYLKTLDHLKTLHFLVF